MKTNKIYLLLFFAFCFISCKNTDFLDNPPEDELVDDSYWTSEDNVRTFVWNFYVDFFSGYGSGYTWGNYFSGEDLNDDFSDTNPTPFTKHAPTSGGGWSFGNVRKANILIDRVADMSMEEEGAQEHWLGIGRFFRGLEYSKLTSRFGDVPWYDKELSEDDDEELYKKRDARIDVMDHVLEDFEYASEHVKKSVPDKGQMIDRYIVLGFMSRVFLFEGTWQKYQEGNTEKAKEYLEAAKNAANEVIESGEYSLGNYRDVFSSLSLSDNPEVMLYREYKEGEITHSLNSYNNDEPQTGASKDAVDSYLADDGLPIGLSSTYEGDHGVDKLMGPRDPRIKETFVSDEFRPKGSATNYSTSGISTHKFLNEDIKDKTEGSSSLNPTDAPIIRYGEVLMNYAEAAYELSTVGGANFTQGDLDKSINTLRDRPGIEMPHLEVSGGKPAVDGQVYDDPDRDSDVSAMLWEIRRERRVELMMEGFRNKDLKRWKKFEYMDNFDNPDTNKGAWIDKSDYDNDLDITLSNGDGQKGYIIPAHEESVRREFDDPRVYLDPIPLDQISLYDDHGAELKQNPGWGDE